MLNLNNLLGSVTCIDGFPISNFWKLEKSLKLEKSCKLKKSVYIYTYYKLHTLTWELSPLGEVLLYGWSPVLHVWILLLHYIQLIKYVLFVKLESSRTVMLPPTASVFCINFCLSSLTFFNSPWLCSLKVIQLQQNLSKR